MINLALCFDFKYKEMALAVVRSILENTEVSNCSFYLVVDMDDAQIRATARYLDSLSVKYLIKTVDQKLFQGLTTKGHITRAAFMRLELARIFPNLEKVLYLDSDLIFIKDVRDIWETDIEGKPLAAVRNAGKSATQRLGLTPSHVYFNSGVMIMDLEYYRRENVRERAYKWLQDNNDSRAFHDQDALNVIYQDKVFELPYRFNMQAFLYRFFFSFADEERARIVQEESEKVVVHFSSGRKPWHRGDLHPHRELFMKYYFGDETPSPKSIAEFLKRTYLRLYYYAVRLKFKLK